MDDLIEFFYYVLVFQCKKNELSSLVEVSPALRVGMGIRSIVCGRDIILAFVCAYVFVDVTSPSVV